MDDVLLDRRLMTGCDQLGELAFGSIWPCTLIFSSFTPFRASPTVPAAKAVTLLSSFLHGKLFRRGKIKMTNSCLLLVN
jgi:hypothetical protein